MVSFKKLMQLVHEMQKFLLILFDGDQAAKLVNTGIVILIHHQER